MNLTTNTAAHWDHVGKKRKRISFLNLQGNYVEEYLLKTKVKALSENISCRMSASVFLFEFPSLWPQYVTVDKTQQFF